MKKKYLVLIPGVCATVSCMSQSKAPENKKPNIIYIMADDLGYADLGSYGQKLIKTPNLDTLASQGTMFTQCYSGSSVSAPARSVLMTGMHTGHTTVRGNFGKGGVVGLGGGEGRVPLKENDTTVAEILQNAGYTTCMVGKWGLGEPNTTGEPNKKGFDEFFGFLNQRRAHTYYPDYIWKNTEKVMLHGNDTEPKTDYTHDMFANYAVDFIERNADKPFFLYLPFCIPHAEYEIPDLGEYKDREWADDLKKYAAMISRMDNTVGRIMKTLKEKGIDDNTYIFFTSDNGATNIADEWTMFESNAPLKGQKRDAYEGGIRVPMIVWNPAVVPAGKINETVWYFADVLPTLADIANADPPKNIDGISVLPAIKGEEQDISGRYLYWEFYEKQGWRAVRLGDWKAIQNGVNNEAPQSIELYNLKEDIGETNNIADQHPEIVMKVKEIFEEAHIPSEHFEWEKK